MKKKKITGIVKFIVCVMIIAIIANFALQYINGSETNGSKALLIEDFYNQSDYEEDLKNEASDIANMTKYDKYKMGLDPSDGSDTDGDSITDKDEIEIYHTDPTKNSTSGDLYSDGYKLAHGMDFNTYYEYQNDLQMAGNSCPEITLEATTSFDFNAIAADYTNTGLYGLAGKDVIKVYSINYYGGFVTIDLNGIDPALTADNVNVYVNKFDGNDAKAVKFTSDGSKITLSESYDAGSRYAVYLVKEQPGKKNKEATVTFGGVDENGEFESGYGVMYGWFTNIKIKYVKTENEAIGEAAKQKLIDAANQILSERRASISENDIEATTKEEVDKIINRSKKLPSIRKPFPLICEYNGTVENLYSYGPVYTWYVYSEDVFATNAATGGESASSQPIKNASFVNGFNPNTDTLTFPNFGTEISNGGVCAGIAHLTTELFNTGTLSNTAETFTYKDKTYSFDITTDAENATLLDKGLSDYQDSKFVKKHKDFWSGLVTKNLNNAQQNFVTMLGRYWQIENNAIDYSKVAKGIDGRDGDSDGFITMSTYDGTVVRSLLNELDNGRICDACFIMVPKNGKSTEGFGHAVNIYGYQRYDTGTELLEGYLFYVYDSNYPGQVGTLNCEISKWECGRETLEYYLDMPGASYCATSTTQGETSAGVLNLFVCLDSEFNVLPN